MSIYIDYDQKRIYIDNSTRSNIQVCKEKARLQNVMGYRLLEKVREEPIDFGHAYHAGIAALYDTMAGGFYDDDLVWHKYVGAQNPVRVAQAVFLNDLKIQGANLPLETEHGRSVERGSMLLEAYWERWRREPYENILRSDGSPLTEIYFETQVAQWGEWAIYYCGTIDRIMLHTIVKRPRIFETKTTGTGLSQFIEQRKPNQQIDGYFKIAWALMSKEFHDLPIITDAVWDCIFVSKRQPNISLSLKDRFMMWGIDKDRDFARQETSRSQLDIEEFLTDVESDAIEFAKWLMSGKEYWPHAKHSMSCHLFGGCPFRQVCSVNTGRQDILNTFYEIRPWDPRKRLRLI